MANKRKAKPRARAVAKGSPHAELPVAQAAIIMEMTPAGVYQAIRDGRLPAGRNAAGRIVVLRGDAKAFVREKIRWLADQARIARGELTDDEWLQRMIDNDPD